MANTKFTDLTDLNEKPATGDVLAIVDVSGTATTKKITVANLMKSDLTGNATTATTAATVTTAAQPAITSVGTLTSLQVAAAAAPSAASDPGNIGEIAWDTGYVYICTASNTWERVAIATW